MTLTAPPTPAAPAQRSPFHAALRRAVLQDFAEDELVLACRWGVLLAAGFRRSEIRKILGATPVAAKAAEQRVQKAVERLDQGN